MQGETDTVGQWLNVSDHKGRQLPNDHWWLLRFQRQHGLQIALDVLAYAQYVPLRLLRRKNLARLDHTFTELVRNPKWTGHFQTILREHGSRAARIAARDGIEALFDVKHVATLRDWVLSLATEEPKPRPSDLPPHYESWFLDLLPHLEREVWLTDMGNPHPAHGLARMLEHWSLFVLMWAWKHEAGFPSSTEPSIIERALDLDRMAVIVTHAFFREGRSTEGGHDVFLLGGPFEIASETGEALEVSSRPVPGSDHWFFRTFNRFVRNVYTHVAAWKDILDKAPSATELLDAFTTRPPLTAQEATRRVQDAQAALCQLLSAHLHPSVQRWPWDETGRPLSRANWESMAAIACWLSRWKPRFERTGVSGDTRIDIPGHRISAVVTWQLNPSANGHLAHELGQVLFVDARFSDIKNRVASAPSIYELVEQLRDDRQDLWIEMPAALLARARERQHALWTSQAAAIGNLLARYSRRDRPVGPDRFEEGSGWRAECEEADHLLRGYGGRVCQYLLQMTRAEAASVLWLDYSADPPQLRHVGGADRLIQHRAERQARFASFCADAEVAAQSGAAGASALQLYRAVASATIEPNPEERLVRGDQSRGEITKFFKQYSDPKPLDAISVPLLVHGRVVGAFSVSGVNSKRQFDPRLYTPLRLVAQHLAQAMVMQSHLWQMRRLNWLASHRPLEEWRMHEAENQFNPLGKVAETLANVFMCPVVHIWLRDAQNDYRFKLHGYTRGDLLRGKQPLVRAPSFEIEDAAPNGQVPLTRHFAAFAVDQWAQNPLTAQAERAGGFVQARYIGQSSSDPELAGEIERSWPSDSQSNYSLSNAEHGMLLLGDDFLFADNAPDYRQAMFATAKMHQCMAFALVDLSEDAAKPAGVVSLYAPATIADSLLPWPTEWRPIVAHIQSYLPYLLMQTEAIANPLERMRRYLLHEGRNELNHVAATTASLKVGLNALLAVDAPEGQVRPWLRSQLPRLNKFVNGSVALGDMGPWIQESQRGLELLKNLIERNAELAQHLMSGEFSENLAVMARLIGNQRSLTQFDPSTDSDFDHATEWFSPRQEMKTSFDSYRQVWRELHVQPDLDGVPRDLEVLTSKRFWHLLTRDLVHNIAKYALPNEPIRIVWSRPGLHEKSERNASLRISNFASFDKNLDRADRLGTWGRRGSAALNPRPISIRATGLMREGQGIGLWGAIEIGKVLDMPLTIEIKPRNDNVALFTFDISIPQRLVRDLRR